MIPTSCFGSNKWSHALSSTLCGFPLISLWSNSRKNQSRIWYLGTTRSNAIDMVIGYNLFYFMFMEMLIPIKFGIKYMGIFTDNQKRECDNLALNFIPCLLKIVQCWNFFYQWNWRLIALALWEILFLFKNTLIWFLKGGLRNMNPLLKESLNLFPLKNFNLFLCMSLVFKSVTRKLFLILLLIWLEH